LILSGDTFSNRLADPVLQQVEHFNDPSETVNDAFRPVVRFWDRITHPAQILSSLPQAVATMLDPADCGPAFIGLPQDIQAMAYDFPTAFFADRLHQIRRLSPDTDELAQAADVLRRASRPLIIAGGGVRYSQAEEQLEMLSTRHCIPVSETVAGKGSLPWNHPNQIGPIGVTGSTSANRAGAEADVVLAVGTRLSDFTTGSWTVFQNPDVKLVSINAGRFDAGKHLARTVVGDAGTSLTGLLASLNGWESPAPWMEQNQEAYGEWNRYVDSVTDPGAPTKTGLPSYAQVIGVVNRMITDNDYAVAAAGGFPGELNKIWRTRAAATFDCEYGFSCMGYEISGAWGARMARSQGEVISFCGDGSYLMLSSDVYSSVLSGHKMIVILCDNGGYSVIQRLQEFKGGAPFNNRYDEGTRRSLSIEVDYAAHAAAMGAITEQVANLEELETAYIRATRADRTSVIVIRTDPYTWTAGDAWWDVGVPEVSDRKQVLVARAEHEAERKLQRPGI
ncbi:MAG TPA: thiamine pyrophosphate-dependent enzyme, partial [Acidimicrobiia bacterium]|nr:thiamine pyrophosphate-dependent enzyme [Acidimicrobiia bacterium]